MNAFRNEINNNAYWATVCWSQDSPCSSSYEHDRIPKMLCDKHSLNCIRNLIVVFVQYIGERKFSLAHNVPDWKKLGRSLLITEQSFEWWFFTQEAVQIQTTPRKSSVYSLQGYNGRASSEKVKVWNVSYSSTFVWNFYFSQRFYSLQHRTLITQQVNNDEAKEISNKSSLGHEEQIPL